MLEIYILPKTAIESKMEYSDFPPRWLNSNKNNNFIPNGCQKYYSKRVFIKKKKYVLSIQTRAI